MTFLMIVVMELVLMMVIDDVLCSGTGYVQGMSDLLAPILVVMENEVDAFWCFAGLIRMMVSEVSC